MTPEQKRDALDIEQAEHLKKLLLDVLIQIEAMKSRDLEYYLHYSKGRFRTENYFDVRVSREFKTKAKIITDSHVRIKE